MGRLDLFFVEMEEFVMKYGFIRRNWMDEGVRMDYRLDFSDHMHLLLTGSSGSGKSYALLYLIGMLIKDGIRDVTLCDYKNSEEFRFLNGYPQYYPGDNAYQGIKAYYDEFQKARQRGSVNGYHVLAVDEYPSMLNYLQMIDKRDKSKLAFELQSMISEMLMLGRGLGYGVWITTQRADASLFANGSRDNFQVICALGRLSKEQRQMLFSGEDVPDTIFGKGEGLLLADGKELVEIKIPRFMCAEVWKSMVRQEFLSLDEKKDIQI